MELTINQTELSKKIALVQGVLENKSVMPMLGHILLKADKTGTTITATDLAVSVCENILATVAVAGQCCIPGRKLNEIVKELDGDIRLSFDNNTLKVKAGGSTFKVACLATKDFPSWPTVDGTQTFKMQKKTLADAMRKTIYSAGESDNRYVLNGLLIHVNGHDLTVVGTDGHRLSIVKETIEAAIDEVKVVMPTKAVNEIKKFLVGDGDVELTIGKNHTRFVVDGVEFFARNIEGVFPDYTKVLPATSGNGIVTDREKLYRCVKRVSLMTSNHTIAFDVADKEIKISSSWSDLGEASDSLPCDYDGEKQQVGFNSSFLLDALSVIEGENVAMFITGSVAPAVIYAAGDGNHKSVIMPMRL